VRKKRESVKLGSLKFGVSFPLEVGTRIRLRKHRVHMIRREIEYLLNESWRVANLVYLRLKHCMHRDLQDLHTSVETVEKPPLTKIGGTNKLK